jgi:ketopantoate reductase
MKKKIAVIGAGGRTGTMFAFELGKASELLGIGRDIEKIKNKELFVERKGNVELFGEKVIPGDQWLTTDFLPEIIFLATKNPVAPVVKFYYQKFKEKNLPPATLVLSQNGRGCIEDALSSLKEVFGQDFSKVRIVRISLFNPIDKKKERGKNIIVYSLPIRISFAKASGPGDLKDLKSLFKKAEIKAIEFPPESFKNMEYSKLFLNLIGIASATRGLSIKKGFKKPGVFQEEVGALKEYIKVVLASNSKFLDIPHYHTKGLTTFIRIFPTKLLLPFRNYFASLIAEGREGKPKQLDEIKYYNGAVVDLGKKVGISTPINQKIVKRVLKQ